MSSKDFILSEPYCIWFHMHEIGIVHCYQVVIHNIRLPKQSTVGDVINELKTKVTFLLLLDCSLLRLTPVPF